jgi:LmbE family N-acetylglucosaminyl deacetylase
VYPDGEQGIEVTYMVLTNGDKGNHNPEITRNQLIAMRQIEQRNAAALSGVKEVLFMGEEDGFLRPHREPSASASHRRFAASARS